jgi:hypothetical protein
VIQIQSLKRRRKAAEVYNSAANLKSDRTEPFHNLNKALFNHHHSKVSATQTSDLVNSLASEMSFQDLVARAAA